MGALCGGMAEVHTEVSPLLCKGMGALGGAMAEVHTEVIKPHGIEKGPPE